MLRQDYPADQIVVAVDHERRGAGENRNRTWRGADTEWVAFLDDDDELHPNHLSNLIAGAEACPEAGVIFPWYRILQMGKVDAGSLWAPPESDEEIPGRIRPEPSFLPINVMVKRELLVATGGFKLGRGEDHRLWVELLDMGVQFHYAPGVTWTWHHWGTGQPGIPGNTSGLKERW